MIPIQIQLIHEHAKIPTKAYETDAGWDLYAINEGFVEPVGQLFVTFGFCMYFPEGYFATIHARSSMRGKGITIPTPVFDYGYTGEVNARLFNLGIETFRFQPGDRIAQMIIHKVEPTQFEIVQSMPQTARGTNGFGSSGR